MSPDSSQSSKHASKSALHLFVYYVALNYILQSVSSLATANVSVRPRSLQGTPPMLALKYVGHSQFQCLAAQTLAPLAFGMCMDLSHFCSAGTDNLL